MASSRFFTGLEKVGLVDLLSQEAPSLITLITQHYIRVLLTVAVCNKFKAVLCMLSYIGCWTINVVLSLYTCLFCQTRNIKF